MTFKNVASIDILYPIYCLKNTSDYCDYHFILFFLQKEFSVHMQFLKRSKLSLIFGFSRLVFQPGKLAKSVYILVIDNKLSGPSMEMNTI